MNNVILTLKDLFTNEVITRTIDATNAYSNGAVCWELGDEEAQRANLERWVTERGNAQHETILELTSWEFV